MTQITLWSPYANDFTPGMGSYVTLQDADTIVAASLHVTDWPATPAAITYDDDADPPFIPDENVAIVLQKMNALTDAAAIIDSFSFLGRRADPHQDLEFPRVYGFRGAFMGWPRHRQFPGDTGFPFFPDFIDQIDESQVALTANQIPVRVAKANAFLAAHLLKQGSLTDHAKLVLTETVGNSKTTYRTPSADPLPHNVRSLLQPFMIGGSAWSQLRP